MVLLLGPFPGPKRYYHIMQSKGEMAKKGKKVDDKENLESAQAVQPANKNQKAAPLPPKSKPKSEAERKKDRIDGITKTVYPSILGAIAGFACFYGAAAISQLPWHFVLLVVLLATYLIQKFTYPFLKIDATSFNGKDWIYVEFMAVDLWLVTWTILLN
jgi:hypothetical protein